MLELADKFAASLSDEVENDIIEAALKIWRTAIESLSEPDLTYAKNMLNADQSKKSFIEIQDYKAARRLERDKAATRKEKKSEPRKRTSISKHVILQASNGKTIDIRIDGKPFTGDQKKLSLKLDWEKNEKVHWGNGTPYEVDELRKEALKELIGAASEKMDSEIMEVLQQICQNNPVESWAFIEETVQQKLGIAPRNFVPSLTCEMFS